MLTLRSSFVLGMLESTMKTFVASLIALAALAAIAAPADAGPHRRHVKVCRIAHHHRVCRWVWR